MPVEAVPFILAILAFFGVFVVAVGGAQMCSVAPRAKAGTDAIDRDRP